MRRRTVLASIVVLAGALLAWHRQRSRAAARPPLDTAVPTPPAALLEQAPRFVSVPWTVVSAPEDRAELTLRYTCTEHMGLDRIDAQETPTQVFVTVLTRWQPPAGGWFAWQQERTATVALSGPLGTRALVHAPVDADGPGDDPSGPPLYP
ncbi:MAG TPA: hypothetical protein VFF79_08905 [Conexibacter sp.]|jgi:hypothetical protein|nr:hypothetical protein [Conexibacter sp.]